MTKGRVEPGLEISHPLKVQRTQAQGVEGTLCNKEERGEPIRKMGKLGGGLCRGRGFPRECEALRARSAWSSAEPRGLRPRKEAAAPHGGARGLSRQRVD